MLPVKININSGWLEFAGKSKVKGGLVHIFNMSLNSKKLKAYKCCYDASQAYILTFETNSGAYELSILGYSFNETS